MNRVTRIYFSHGYLNSIRKIIPFVYNTFFRFNDFVCQDVFRFLLFRFIIVLSIIPSILLLLCIVNFAVQRYGSNDIDIKHSSGITISQYHAVWTRGDTVQGGIQSQHITLRGLKKFTIYYAIICKIYLLNLIIQFYTILNFNLLNSRSCVMILKLYTLKW